MRIGEYLNEIKKAKLSEQEKFFLYDKILLGKGGRHSKIRYQINVKKVVYFGILVFLLLGIYGVYFLDLPNVVKNDKDFLITRRLENTVQAGYVAKIMEFTGDFHIEKNNTILKTSTIENNDVIIVKTGSIISFSIVDGSKVQIIGPAKISINKLEDAPYKLLIQEGKFISITNDTQEKQNQSMEVIVKDKITIQTSSENTNFQIAKKRGEYFINNKGKPLSISSIKGKNKILKSNKILTVTNNNDISTIQDSKTFAKAMNNKDVSQSFDLTKPLTKKLVVNETPTDNQTVLLKGNTGENKKINNISNISNINSGDIKLQGKDKEDKLEKSFLKDKIESILADKKIEEKTILSGKEIEKILNSKKIINKDNMISSLVDGKRVFTDNQRKQLSLSINNFFLENNMKSIFKEYLKGDSLTLTKNLDKLNNKLLLLSDELSISVEKRSLQSTLDGVKKNFLFVKEELLAKYHTPIGYVNTIDQSLSWINIISSQKFGMMLDKDDTIISKKVEELLK